MVELPEDDVLRALGHPQIRGPSCSSGSLVPSAKVLPAGPHDLLLLTLHVGPVASPVGGELRGRLLFKSLLPQPWRPQGLWCVGVCLWREGGLPRCGLCSAGWCCSPSHTRWSPSVPMHCWNPEPLLRGPPGTAASRTVMVRRRPSLQLTVGLPRLLGAGGRPRCLGQRQTTVGQARLGPQPGSDFSTLFPEHDPQGHGQAEGPTWAGLAVSHQEAETGALDSCGRDSPPAPRTALKRSPVSLTGHAEPDRPVVLSRRPPCGGMDRGPGPSPWMCRLPR